MPLPVNWGVRLAQAGLGGDPGAGRLLAQSWSPAKSPWSPSPGSCWPPSFAVCVPLTLTAALRDPQSPGLSCHLALDSAGPSAWNTSLTPCPHRRVLAVFSQPLGFPLYNIYSVNLFT